MNTAYSAIVSHSPLYAKSPTLTTLTRIHTAQFSMNLRPSRIWPTTLTAVGNPSHQGTSVLSVKVLRNKPVAGQSRAQAATVRTSPRDLRVVTRSCVPSARTPRSHWNQPHSATTAKKICRAASP